MTSRESRSTLKSRSLYDTHASLPPEQKAAAASRRINRAKSERERWTALFACTTWLLDGLPEDQRRSLAMTAIWQLAVSACRRYLRTGRAEAVPHLASDLAIVLSNSIPDLSIRDFERIAANAFHSASLRPFKATLIKSGPPHTMHAR